MPQVIASLDGSLGASSDEELARRALAGCAASFAELDRRMRPRLMAALYRRLPSHDDREEVAQQALARAYERLGDYDDRWRFTTWLFTIAFRLASDLRRQQRRRGGAELTEDVKDARQREPWRAAADAELRGNLWATAERVLDERSYTLLWLRFAEGLDNDEIATALKLTRLHVRVLQHRALKRLRSVMEAEQDPQPAGEVAHA